MRCAAGLLVLAWGAAATATAGPAVPATGIAAFNDALSAATRAMDNTAALALWEDDGVSLMPNAPPLVGKPAIAAFLTRVTQHLRGAHMISFELGCHDAIVGADLATEWCDEHQVVSLTRTGKTFEGRGHMLLVLHRATHGQWKIEREMWEPAAARH